MYLYYVKNIKGMPYVIHKETGCSIPYRNKKFKDNIADIPSYKLGFFLTWLHFFSNNDRKKIKKMSIMELDTYPTLNVNHIKEVMNSLVQQQPYTMRSLASFPKIEEACNSTKNKKSEDTMCKPYNSNYNTATTVQLALDNGTSENADKRAYLTSRLSRIYYAKDRELGMQFGLHDDAYPETAKELIERIKSGLYVLPKEDDDFGPTDIRWRDPNKIADRAGYTAASKLLAKEREKIQDQIVIADPADTLKALYDLESWTPPTTAKQ